MNCLYYRRLILILGKTLYSYGFLKDLEVKYGIIFQQRMWSKLVLI